MASLSRHAVCFIASFLLIFCFTDATETCDFESATYGPYIEDIVERVMIGLPQQSFSDCVKKCALRPWCKLLGYHRMAKVCELYFDDLTVLEHISAFDGNPKTMMYIRREDLNTEDREKCDKQCPYNSTSLLQTCDFTSETPEKCRTDVCPPFDKAAKTNGVILGNMHMEGDRRRLECNQGYLPLDLNNVTSQCQNGRWTNVTTCVQVCPQFENKKHGTVVGDSIYENATRNLTCNEGYSPLDPAKTVSKCTMGHWTEITKCIPKTCLTDAFLKENWSDSYYLFTKYKEDAFDKAKNYCWNCGGHLIIIESSSEHEWVKREVSNLADIDSFWLGVQKEETDKIRSVYGNTNNVPYVSWGELNGEREPNSLNDYCVCADIRMDWSFNDVPCTSQLYNCYVVCELHN